MSCYIQDIFAQLGINNPNIPWCRTIIKAPSTWHCLPCVSTSSWLSQPIMTWKAAAGKQTPERLFQDGTSKGRTADSRFRTTANLRYHHLNDGVTLYVEENQHSSRSDPLSASHSCRHVNRHQMQTQTMLLHKGALFVITE